MWRIATDNGVTVTLAVIRHQWVVSPVTKACTVWN